MNRINPRKLLNSKWTAVDPVGNEKHFMVTGIAFGSNKRVVSCTLLAIISNQLTTIDWLQLIYRDP
tara:strand:- start:284 stop:481 length:198 start_codon:yes stop_codon:yes gene_type:complete